MAKISLRAYLREINTFIESKKIDLAFEHCKHILKSYPKYIDIYRLLGKAYLESSRYEEAEGIFRRVLAVLPDDFVSHLGLSVVKEENSDLDTAIWHMERAYELKSTQTIHEELHRLFTQRDGIAPPKPLITRGALIRINVRSGLYQQALKEIDLALKEDSQRIDLEILRAQIYYKLNNIPHTLRYCQQVIKKRPYAYDINTMLAEIAETPEQAEPFKQRLYELDPYTSFVTESTNLGDVQDDLIMIEKLDLQPAIEAEQADETQEYDESISQEEYADTQEVSILDDSEDSFEDSTLLEAQSHESAHIPDWMKEAGWEAGTPKPPEEEQALIEQYDQAGDLPDLEMTDTIDELEEEELPEWIKDFAPAEAARDELPSLFSEDTDEEEEKIAWLDAILSGEEEGKPVSAPEQSEIMDEPVEPKGMPAFGEDLAADQEWLEKISTQEGLMADQQQSEDRQSRMPAPEDINQFVFDDDEEDVEILEEPAAIDEPVEMYAEEADEDDIDSAIAWLEGLAAKQGADEEVLFSAPETRDEQPEWIFDNEEESEIETVEEPIQESQPVESSVEFETGDETIPSLEILADEIAIIEEIEEQPDEIRTEEPVEFMAEAEGAAEEEEEETAFAFEYDQEIGSPEALADAVEIDEESQDVPEWLKAIAPPEKVTKPLSTDIPIEKIPTEDEEETSEVLDEVSLEVEVENEEEFEEEWDQLLTEQEEEQQAASIPDAERMATTAVLDFIKQEVDSDVSEIDEWLKNLPDLPEDITTLEEDREEEIPVTEEEIDTTLSTVTQERDHGPVDFIDDFFSEAIDEEETELAVSGDEPYQWEQIYEEDDLPDWISDISEDDLGETFAQPSSAEEKESELPDMPAWIAGEDESEHPEIVAEETVSEPMEHLEGLEEEEVPDDVGEAVEEEAITELEESTVTQEIEEIEVDEPITTFEPEEPLSADLEELFVLAKNQLHNGEFNVAHPQLEKLMQDDQWTQDVIDVLLFDIENYHPIEVHSWMLLGDAYRKKNNLQQALDAYTKAEGFIK